MMGDISSMSPILPIILCGGSGTRLWPLSRKDFPKQFVPMINGSSLLDLTFERVRQISSSVYCVASQDHRFLVAEAARVNGCQATILLEPEGRNTAAAIALSILAVQGATKDNPYLLVCPSDHYIPDVSAFTRMIEAGCRVAGDHSIVTFGILPTYPATEYGYIHCDSQNGSDDFRNVQKFIEKPDVQKAKALIAAGDVFWNAGIFLMRAQVMADALSYHAPEIWSLCQAAMANKKVESCSTNDPTSVFVLPDRDSFLSVPSVSIDVAVMEKFSSIRLVPFQGDWSDVGGWVAVADLTPGDEQGNRLVGSALALGSQNVYVRAPYRPVVTLGVHDLVVVDTIDAVLVAHTSQADNVRQVVTELEKVGRPQAQAHRKVYRPWGWYDLLEQGPGFQVKRLMINIGASISLQLHHHRDEHWVVIQGQAHVQYGNEKIILGPGQSAHILKGMRHRLTNMGDCPLSVIEVQTGDYLGEDDIVRFDDQYGRVEYT